MYYIIIRMFVKNITYLSVDLMYTNFYQRQKKHWKKCIHTYCKRFLSPIGYSGGDSVEWFLIIRTYNNITLFNNL